MSYRVELTYFKDSGKYYSDGEYESSFADLHEIFAEARKLVQDGRLPGLCEGARFTTLVNVPGHPHEHPHLIPYQESPERAAVPEERAAVPEEPAAVPEEPAVELGNAAWLDRIERAQLLAQQSFDWHQKPPREHVTVTAGDVLQALTIEAAVAAVAGHRRLKLEEMVEMVWPPIEDGPA